MSAINFGARGAISEETALALYRDAANKRRQIGVLADLLDCTGKDVTEWLISRGYQPKIRKRENAGVKNRWTDDEVKRLAREYRAGTTCAKCAELLGRSKSAVTAKIFELNLRGERY